MLLKRTFKRLYEKLRFNLSANDSFLFIGFYKYFFTPKKGSLDFFLDAYSKYKEGKVTIFQVGANDGLTKDPMHKFIKRDQWGGILLEPQKYVFDTFLTRIYKNNPQVIPLNVALGEADGEVTMYKIAFCNHRWAHGLTGFNRKVLESEFESGYVFREAARHNVEVPADKQNWITEEKVKMLSIPSILKNHPVGPIDLVQIDAEGFDFEVIKMIDFDQLNPDVISFEWKHFGDALFAECESHLAAHGFKIRKLGKDAIAVRQSVLDATGMFE